MNSNFYILHHEKVLCSIFDHISPLHDPLVEIDNRHGTVPELAVLNSPGTVNYAGPVLAEPWHDNAIQYWFAVVAPYREQVLYQYWMTVPSEYWRSTGEVLPLLML